MARKKYTVEEIIQHLRTIEIEQAKGLTFEEAARKVGVGRYPRGYDALTS